MPIVLNGSTGINQSGVSGSTVIPIGTTSERPSNPENGMIRFNTDLGYIEYYDEAAGQWRATSDTGST